MKKFLLNILTTCKNRSEVSRKAGIPLNTINNWIFRGVEPTLTNAEKVFKALGYSIFITPQKGGE